LGRDLPRRCSQDQATERGTRDEASVDRVLGQFPWNSQDRGSLHSVSWTRRRLSESVPDERGIYSHDLSLQAIFFTVSMVKGKLKETFPDEVKGPYM
jgi:hypothetical protein